MAAEPALIPPSTEPGAVVAAAARALPWAAASFHVPPGSPFLGSLDLADVLDRAAVRWPDVSPAVLATLWWYGSSSTLATVSIAQLAVTGRCVDLAHESARVTVGETGTVASSTAAVTVGDTAAGASFADAVDALVEAVRRRVPSVSGASLWAIASDSVANRALDVACALDRVDDAPRWAALLTSERRRHPFPTPRFVDVTANGRSRRFLRRSSCCRVVDAGEDLCTSCPRRTPADRAARWAALVGR
ncbi:hypothetical protein [Rhodococcoides corynebacterioides]|uniref:hypothetical protein n=1 Tax=Rhodococcoides corynebacterioides TaxID=53972 RepID=UPI00082A311F|nr:hypothetical protein [Rhodococcus corynebacterioides]